MRIWLFLTFLAFVTTACGDDKKSSADKPATEKVACESNEDCQTGWACLDGECASTVTKDIYADPGNAVTPEKVKRELEKRTKQHADRVDKVLDM